MTEFSTSWRGMVEIFEIILEYLKQKYVKTRNMHIKI